GTQRQTTYSQVSTGFQVRAGVPLTEYWSLAGRYGLSYDQVGLDSATYFTNGVCDPLKAGRYLCEAIGNRWTSTVGYSLIYDSLNSRLRPTAGQRFAFNQDFAGLGGDVKYIRTRVEGSKFWNVGSGFIGSIVGEGGYIHSLEKSRGPGIDSVRITDRFYLGEPQFRGFDIRGVGPRVQRQAYTTDANGKQILVTDRDQIVDDALGGRAYYLVRAELEIPLGSGARELGLRPSVYVQAGSLWGLTKPLPTASFPTITDSAGNVTVLPIQRLLTDSAGRQLYYNTYTPDGATAPALRATTCSIGYSAVAGGACSGSETNTIAFDQAISPFKETYYGSSPTPRVSIGIGVNWTSPFGPLRIDLAKALVTQKGDDPKLITFNVGTQF
ncbi:BamA/TamA family outer membrane protein, partial [Sphingomonas melonis]|uniref:BamA/TamA family outer membrane protein n=2 Tax=Sphingomonas TaxID=13687 RepID=UPI0035C84DE5